MKIVTLLLTLIPFFTQAQKAVINFRIKDARSSHIEIEFGNYVDANILFGKADSLISINSGKAKWIGKLTSPSLLTATYLDSATEIEFSYVFYLRPGDNLRFSFDVSNSKMPYRVSGKGSKNNQPLAQKFLTNRIDVSSFKNDTLPDNIIRAITKRDSANREVLSQYISNHQPTKDFEKLCTNLNQSLSLLTYIPFKGSQRYNVYKSFLRNENRWQVVEDSLIKNIGLPNNDMLFINDFSYLLSIYLQRTKERIWQNRSLLLNYYNTESQIYADSLFAKDPENLLKEKIIAKHFNGRSAEFLTAVLFKSAFGKEETNLPEIFARFKKEYPKSKYLPFIEPAIEKIVFRRSYPLTDEMVFIRRPETYQTFDQLFELVKGEAVLLNMWGTWCAPCLSEFSLHSDSIKNYFSGSSLKYLYVANYDEGKEEKWKELIAYYRLKGNHILASAELTKDIMSKVKRDGFPTYIIIKKDGSYELSEAGYPMIRSLLIKQLEEALTN